MVRIMDRVLLKELNMKTRNEVLAFLKKLWHEDKVKCPICDSDLELLHKKSKKNNCDWQCKTCNKTFKTLYLLDELNEQMPK